MGVGLWVAQRHPLKRKGGIDTILNSTGRPSLRRGEGGVLMS